MASSRPRKLSAIPKGKGRTARGANLARHSTSDLYRTLDRFAEGLALVAVAYRSMRARALGVDQEMG